MTLLYPWFLLALFSLSIPIVIHFFELRKPQLINFTNVKFIAEVNLIAAHQRKIKHLLTLLLRLGFIVFLVLLFCQPFIPSFKPNIREVNTVSMLVDTSPSMWVPGTNGQSILEQATKEVHSLTTIYPASAQFRLGINSQPLTKEELQSAAGQLTIPGRMANMFSGLAKPSRKVSNEQTFIFSDFQKNNFNSTYFAQFDSAQQVFLVPLSGESTANVYVDSVAIDDAFVRKGADISLRIRLRNGGNIISADRQVKLFLGDKQAATYSVTIEPNSTFTSTVLIRLTSNDLQQCRVEIDDPAVSFDNVYYFTLQPSAPIRIVDFTVNKPATQQLFSNEDLFLYTESTSKNIDYKLLEGANIIFVQQPTVDVNLRVAVKKLVDSGKSIGVIPPAEPIGRNSYTQLFQELGIGSIQWNTAPVTTPVMREVATPSLQSPFFRDVFASQSRQTVMPKVSPVLRWSRSEEDILRLRDGEGFLAKFNSGRGAVYVFSAPFEKSYSDFTAHALFVPVMYRLAMQSFHDDQQIAYRIGQQAVAVTVPEDLGNIEQVFKLTKGSQTFIPSQRLQAGTLRFDLPPAMQEPGFYQLTLNGRVIKTLAFNFEKRESELARYSAAELRGMIGAKYPNIQVYEPSTTQTVAAQYKAERVGTPLWHYCLWAALACLLAEALLLRFMKGHKTTELAMAA